MNLKKRSSRWTFNFKLRLERGLVVLRSAKDIIFATWKSHHCPPLVKWSQKRSRRKSPNFLLATKKCSKRYIQDILKNVNQWLKGMGKRWMVAKTVMAPLGLRRLNRAAAAVALLCTRHFRLSQKKPYEIHNIISPI